MGDEPVDYVTLELIDIVMNAHQEGKIALTEKQVEKYERIKMECQVFIEMNEDLISIFGDDSY